MKNQSYDQMYEDGIENKLLLHTDEEFQQGIHFKVKVN